MLDMPEAVAEWLEDTFLRIADQQGCDAMQQLLLGNVRLDQSLRSGWSRFIMSLILRTPDKVAWVRKQYADTFEKIATETINDYDQHHINDQPPPSPEKREEDFRRARELGEIRLLKNVMDLPNVGLHLNNMQWRVFTLENGRRDLLTADRPVFMSGGIHHPESYLSLPISPTKLFVAANDPRLLDKFAAMPASDITRNSNETVSLQARNYVFGTDDFQINFVRARLQTLDARALPQNSEQLIFDE